MQQKTKKFKAYIYPQTKEFKSGNYNPYIENFIRSTGNGIIYLNHDQPSKIGIFDLFKFIKRIDLVLFNWVENLPDRKRGVVQAIGLLFLLMILKLNGVIVIWTLHNKFSHSSYRLSLKKLLFNTILRKSDLIITHAREGISFAESLCPGVSSRILYFPHPVTPARELIKNNPDKKYDILIWGSLAPYKGIDVFLDYLEKNNALSRHRILIAGKAGSPEFFEKIKKFENENITIKNQFINSDELAVMIRQSKIILFTYSGNSVLSSGALIDSISYGATIIGPYAGAFAELGEEGIIRTYKSLDELMVLLENSDNVDQVDASGKLSDYIKAHTWSEFSKVFFARLNRI
jgi:beta-1,4-mannosyltransferase